MQVYVWGRRHPYVNLSFLGIFNFSAPYLPWVLLAFSVTLRSNAVVDLLGIVAGALPVLAGPVCLSRVLLLTYQHLAGFGMLPHAQLVLVLLVPLVRRLRMPAGSFSPVIFGRRFHVHSLAAPDRGVQGIATTSWRMCTRA